MVKDLLNAKGPEQPKAFAEGIFGMSDVFYKILWHDKR